MLEHRIGLTAVSKLPVEAPRSRSPRGRTNRDNQVPADQRRARAGLLSSVDKSA